MVRRQGGTIVRATIIGLDRYGLDLRALKAHKSRSISYSISLVGPDLEALLPLKPKQRLMAIESHLADSILALRTKFVFETLSPRNRKTSWISDVRSTVGTFASLSRARP